MQEWTIVIMVLTSLSIVSGASLLGVWLKLRYQHRHSPKLTERLEEMRLVVGELQDRLDSQTAELHERLDYAERALTRGTELSDEVSASTPV